MKPRWIPVAAAFALTAHVAFGASRLELARSAQQQAREQVTALRGRQAAQQAELDTLGSRIETLKAHRKNKLLVSSDLQQALQRSQELSGSLTSVETELKTAEHQSSISNEALAEALNDALSTLRNGWERATAPEDKARLISQMRLLRAEREQVRALLPSSSIPSVGPARSEDPEELLEQADALRDAEDKARKQLAMLDHRISELRDERDLDRRMGQFNRDQKLFDEQDRSLRTAHDPHLEESHTATTPAMFGMKPQGVDPAGPPGNASGVDSAVTPALPPVLSPPPLTADLLGSSNLEALEGQRARLQALAAQLKQRAAQAAAKAKELQ